MELKGWSDDHKAQIMRFVNFLGKRSKGEIPTGARFIRNWVAEHPAYNRDSKLNDQINFDILTMMSHINDSDSEARRVLLGEYA